MAERPPDLSSHAQCAWCYKKMVDTALPCARGHIAHLWVLPVHKVVAAIRSLPRLPRPCMDTASDRESPLLNWIEGSCETMDDVLALFAGFEDGES